ncbi:hypothetical protein [Scopulibacillus darangshiensis]|uniref:hypothetical protein n=1 Tax=Scopulibacillus darangshiensis TaxID=442528 RepID=UPI00104DA16E|nr:hypothetical protein [Scopulibacillus darangshiensis]
MKRKKKIISFVVLMFLSLIMVKPVLAFDHNVIKDEATVIQKNQTVDNVVTFGNNAVINGTVRDAVIVINGDLSIKSTAKIKGLVLVIGGKIDQQKGASINDEVYALSFNNGKGNSFLIAGLFWLGSWTVSLALSILFVILSFLAGLLLRNRLTVFVRPIRHSFGKLVIVGAITSVLLTAVNLLLSITIIGIPVAIALFFVPLIFFFIGSAAVSKIIGKQIASGDETPLWATLLYGAAILVAGINVPFFGALLLLGLIWLSTGLMAFWLFDKMKRKKAA